MTIPSQKLITQITNLLINSKYSKKQYHFKSIKCIDGLDVTVTIFLENNPLNIYSSCIIKSNIMGIQENIYCTGSFNGDANTAVGKTMNELYRVLPFLKVDKLRGELVEYLDEELGTTYIKTDGCSVCLEHTYTKLRCKHLLCISCQNSMSREKDMFNCPICRIPHYSFNDECSDDEA
jgi:hypothetical protein